MSDEQLRRVSHLARRSLDGFRTLDHGDAIDGMIADMRDILATVEDTDDTRDLVAWVDRELLSDGASHE